jgi:UDP-N-acetylmuramate dehydrogenase
MEVHENVPLALLTTFKVGGKARYVVKCFSEEDVVRALAFIRERALPWYVIGGGSNVLASDEGYEGVIIQPLIPGISFQDTKNETDPTYTVTAGAGVVWDELVQECALRALWGLENLAAIPGLVGGAPVQNIGAYGADVSDTILYVDALDTRTSQVTRFTKEECAFGYRDSRFKHDPSFIILRAAFSLSSLASPRIHYADLSAYAETHTDSEDFLNTPLAIARAVREIRSHKFPDLNIYGTAGSFFKNPIISKEQYASLQEHYPEMPGFSSTDSVTGLETIKIPLAWILDHVLNLNGMAQGNVKHFERQPLVLVANSEATTKEVEALAHTVEEKVFDATGITIEREVRKL